MLKQLTLKNFVLVESLDIDFAAGLTTITGESGAGKSILLNALGLLLGERARTDVIRPGTDKADVSAEFDVAGQPALMRRLLEDELVEEDGLCLVRRVVASNGRSRAFVNGIPVTAQVLKEIGEDLVDIHGQNDHQRLANAATQLELLDDYAGLAKDTAKLAAHFHSWQGERRAIEAARDRQYAAADRRDLLTYQLSELDEFDLQPGEFSSLEAEHRRLASAQTTLASLADAFVELEDLERLRGAARAIADIDDDNTDLVAARDTLDSALGLIDDAARDLSRFADQVVQDPEALSACEARLNTGHDLARKHRVQGDELADHAHALRAELGDLDADDSALAELGVSVEVHRAAFMKLAKTVSNKRKKAAPKFSKEVTGYMKKLGIKDGDFTVEFSEAEHEAGTERIAFHVTTNPKFPAGPLKEIASGGEQTRIDLSIQIVAANHSALPCLILDEADVGVGGTTADTVGRILRELGTHTQVICVTHAPQVAALGDFHYRVTKDGDNTDIVPLDEDLRVDELARMLAGADINDDTREYAQALLRGAH